MSTRRMISSKICCSDNFLQLPARAQAMYIQLVLLADNDGFVDNVWQARSTLHAKKSEVQALVDAGFLYVFPEGTALLRQWRQSNSLRWTTKKPCGYPHLASRIYVLPNGCYTLDPTLGGVCLDALHSDTIPESSTRTTKIAPSAESENAGIEENRIEQNRTEQNRTEENRTEAAAAFRALWSAYPAQRRGAEREGLEAYEQTILGHTHAAEAMSNLERWKSSEQWRRENGRFIPSLPNYLRRGLWCSPPAGSTVASCTLGDPELEAIHALLNEAKQEEGIEQNYDSVDEFPDNHPPATFDCPTGIANHSNPKSWKSPVNSQEIPSRKLEYFGKGTKPFPADSRERQNNPPGNSWKSPPGSLEIPSPTKEVSGRETMEFPSNSGRVSNISKANRWKSPPGNLEIPSNASEVSGQETGAFPEGSAGSPNISKTNCWKFSPGNSLEISSSKDEVFESCLPGLSADSCRIHNNSGANSRKFHAEPAGRGQKGADVR